MWISNHRSVAGILAYIRRLGALVGAAERAERYADSLERQVARVRQRSASLRLRPRVYFEEWDEPPITAIQWVSELIEIAGGEDIFADRMAGGALARNRIIDDPGEVIRRSPQVIFGSWCGKRFRPELVRGRPGWEHIPAVRDGALHEIKSPLILQPGPAALSDGLDALHQVLHGWAEGQVSSG